jgi:sec-independent protein translocase protein TatC
MKPRNPKKLEFSAHLQELKNRFLVWFIFFIALCCLSYYWYPSLLQWLIIPLHGPLIYTSPTGALQTVFGVCILFGLILSLPVLLYQILKFFEPAFTPIPALDIFRYLILSFGLALAGFLTAYYLVLPATLNFLSGFSGQQLTALISAQDYFSFIYKYLLGFAVLFQLPLVIFILSKFTKLRSRTLLHYWRQVIVLSFLFAAILTPTPDPVNQTLLAAPILVLYFISVATLALAHKVF